MGAVGVEVDPQRERLDRRLAPGARDDTVLRRSATSAPVPLQNVRTSSASPRRGNRATHSRSRRSTHTPPPSSPESTTSASAASCSHRAIASSRARPDGRDVGEAGRGAMAEHPAVGGRRDELGLRHYPVPRR